jgi:hypothetical protein
MQIHDRSYFFHNDDTIMVNLIIVDFIKQIKILINTGREYKSNVKMNSTKRSVQEL